jgi:hypothetical protein
MNETTPDKDEPPAMPKQPAGRPLLQRLDLSGGKKKPEPARLTVQQAVESMSPPTPPSDPRLPYVGPDAILACGHTVSDAPAHCTRLP